MNREGLKATSPMLEDVCMTFIEDATPDTRAEGRHAPRAVIAVETREDEDAESLSRLAG